MASEEKNARSSGSSRKRSDSRAFVLCVRNEGYAASLERRKLYRVIPDAAAARHKLLRIVDESGEDYLYPAAYFVGLRLPAEVKLALLRTA